VAIVRHNSIVIASTRTGNDVNRKIAVIKIDQTRRGALSIEIILWCIFKIVEIKLMASNGINLFNLRSILTSLMRLIASKFIHPIGVSLTESFNL